MSLKSLIGIEYTKIRRSKIGVILLLATCILWIPSIVNADLNFTMQAEGITPENNFFIQGFMAMSWFMFPATMLVSTVLINQTERKNSGMLKMLSMPISIWRLCLAKYVVLLTLAALQIMMSVGMYYISAAIASQTQEYNLLLSPLFVCKEAALIWLSAIPMLAIFWLLTICIQTPIVPIGLGFASIVPSVLIINTKFWFAYPMAYPFFFITSEYGKLAKNLTTTQAEPIPWIPTAIFITLVCVLLSCIRFGKYERR
ncbi:ABC transporter permease [Anaerosporobacter faecicola]|uniref:ABC transporter permease n=1 Tax=Anaerosporobacter faecicola TaxID=2718714 RepID=UPI0014390026|nr:ABC transporter permease [Anaerosporobacter faecicola]